MTKIDSTPTETTPIKLVPVCGMTLEAAKEVCAEMHIPKSEWLSYIQPVRKNGPNSKRYKIVLPAKLDKQLYLDRPKSLSKQERKKPEIGSDLIQSNFNTLLGLPRDTVNEIAAEAEKIRYPEVKKPEAPEAQVKIESNPGCNLFSDYSPEALPSAPAKGVKRIFLDKTTIMTSEEPDRFIIDIIPRMDYEISEVETEAGTVRLVIQPAGTTKRKLVAATPTSLWKDEEPTPQQKLNFMKYYIAHFHPKRFIAQ